MENTPENSPNSNADLSAIFPMRMTSIEKLHWFENDPDRPNNIFFRIRVVGRIDQQTARRAWAIAVGRQPFADVKPEKIKRQWHWTLGPRKHHSDAESFEKWNGTRFEWTELDRPPAPWRFSDHPVGQETGSFLGVTVWPEKRAGGGAENQGPASTEAPESAFVSEVWVYVHHAIGDGVGGAMVVVDWMEAYGNLMNDRPPEAGLHRLDATLLKHRNRIGLLSWRYLKHLPKQPIALFGAIKFIFRKTSELLPAANRAGECDGTSNEPTTETGSSNSPREYPAIIGKTLDRAIVESLDRHIESHGVMANSVLLGQLYLAIAQWRKEQGIDSENEWMRIILPMSIRNVSDRRIPCTNRATIVQIDRCARDMADLSRFYYMLDREIKIIRGWQLDKIFLMVVRAISMFEPLLKRSARSPKSRGMAVFTNLGDPFRKIERGNSRRPKTEISIRPAEFDLAGPIRTGTPVNISVARYQNTIRVSLHYDVKILSADQAERLLEIYVDRLTFPV